MDWVPAVSVLLGSGGLAAIIIGGAREWSLLARTNRRVGIYAEALPTAEPGSVTERALKQALERSQLELAALGVVRHSRANWNLMIGLALLTWVAATLIIGSQLSDQANQEANPTLVTVSVLGGAFAAIGGILLASARTLSVDRRKFVETRISDASDNEKNGQKETPPPA